VSTELEIELAHLGKAEKDLVDGEVRMSEQLARIQQLRSDGHDTKHAEHLLRMLQMTLDEWKAHRAEILRRIGYLQ
jgi:hypothetical protein